MIRHSSLAQASCDEKTLERLRIPLLHELEALILELGLRWLARHEQQPSEDVPLGLILCAGKSDEHVELLKLDETGIHVAAYLTELPPHELLEKKLHDVVRIARAQLEAHEREDVSA